MNIFGVPAGQGEANHFIFAWFSTMSEYVKIADISEVPGGSLKSVVVGSDEVCLANVDGELYAIGNVCTHAGCSLSDGWLEEAIVECACHGSRFDLTTGQPVRGPASRPEPTYEVKIDDSSILIKKRS